MPTFEKLRRFVEQYDKLTPSRRAEFKAATRKLNEDLRRGQFRKGLRVKRVQGRSGVWELTWANDGRATFEHGESIIPGEPHIIWRRVGGHEIFDDP